MRLSIGILVVALCTTALAQTCSQLTITQCASNCSCQRVACCCGAGCDKQGTSGTVQYNQCVPANSPYEDWTGCPSTTACSAFSGLVRTISPCVVPTPAPTIASNQQTGLSSIPFGATFPMIGTAALPKQTWQDNVYMGTIDQFNPGAFFGYTNSYSEPNWNTASTGYDSNGNLITSAPTPQPNATGEPCNAITQPCPTGWYCQLTEGYNVQQSGTCQAEDPDTWNGGAGKFTDSQWYTSLANPPLILNPNQNGAPVNNIGYGYGGYASYYGANGASSWGTPIAPGALGAQSCQPLPTGAPVCGYKSFTGTCFCDSECSSHGDCCADYAQFCGVLSAQYTGPYTPPTPNPFVPSNPYVPPAAATTPGQCDPVGQCANSCGSPVPVIGQNGANCYCDSQCSLTGDCCCSASQCH